MLVKTIRDETVDLHQELESGTVLQLLVQDQLIDLAAYGLVLSRLYGVMFPLENAVSQASKQYKALMPFITPTLRCHLLVNDLLACGIDYQKIQLCGHFDKIVCCEEFIAISYILEGSKLGSKFIANQLNKLNLQLPTSYFTLGSDLTNQQWGDFCRQLDEVKEVDLKQVSANARKIYSVMIEYLQQ